MKRADTGTQAPSADASNLVPLRPAVGRAEILGRYWELAKLDPEITKGTITGQLKALDSLCQELALEEGGEDDPAAGELPQQIYRSAWMRDPAQEAPDNDGATAPRAVRAQAGATTSKRASSPRKPVKAAAEKAGSAADDE